MSFVHSQAYSRLRTPSELQNCGASARIDLRWITTSCREAYDNTTRRESSRKRPTRNASSTSSVHSTCDRLSDAAFLWCIPCSLHEEDDEQRSLFSSLWRNLTVVCVYFWVTGPFEVDACKAFICACLETLLQVYANLTRIVEVVEKRLRLAQHSWFRCRYDDTENVTANFIRIRQRFLTCGPRTTSCSFPFAWWAKPDIQGCIISHSAPSALFLWWCVTEPQKL